MAELAFVTTFDPEIVIPSDDSVSRLEFWIRLQDWTRDPRPLMGPLTAISFHKLLENPPVVKGLPMADFWRIVGKLVARVNDYAGEGHPYCEDHLREAYAPYYGHSENFELLIDAISSRPTGRKMALATDERCWTQDILGDGCERCSGQGVSTYQTPDDRLARVWRDEFVSVGGFDPSALAEYSQVLFPNLIFSETAWNHLDTLSGDVRNIIADLVAHLGVLNDYASEIWSSQLNTVDRQSHLGAFGISASPENANTRNSATAMKVRTFTIEGESIRCEWHTKLHPARDRIYFAVHGERVYVGAIIKHL